MRRELIGAISRAWEAGYRAGLARRELWEVGDVHPWSWVLAGYRHGKGRPAELEQLSLFEATGQSHASDPASRGLGVVADAASPSGPPRELGLESSGGS